MQHTRVVFGMVYQILKIFGIPNDINKNLNFLKMKLCYYIENIYNNSGQEKSLQITQDKNQNSDCYE